MNIKEIWNAWRESTPADKDMQRAFERACTPKACHGVLIELESANQKIAELEKERGVLTEFVSWSLDAVFSGSDICGDAAQDKMFELGILTREIYDPEIHNLAQGSECDAGDYIYFKAPKEQE
jgi:hypothetical protein